ncbi:MAG: hypothetical protein WCK09_10815, partial [Bacteroidota bacterium]
MGTLQSLHGIFNGTFLYGKRPFLADQVSKVLLVLLFFAGISNAGLAVTGVTTYDFESLGTGNKTFTSDGINFSLTGSMVGEIFTLYGSGSPPSNGYMDTFGNNKTISYFGGIKSTNSINFKLSQLDVWPSSDNGNNVLGYGQSIVVTGYLNSVPQYTVTITSVTFNQTPIATGGAWHRITLPATEAGTEINEFSLACAAANYIAVDNFVFTKVTTPSGSLSATTLNGFGNVCNGTTSGPNSFTITGTTLTTANVTVGALTGFNYCTTAGGTYASSLSLTQPGGSYSQAIYVKFSPTAVQSYNGNIPVGGGGATSINVAAAGSGIACNVEVTATAVVTGPTYYSTLKAAFDAINLGTHQGVITVKINASTTETASAVINASGSGTSPNISSYTAVTIYPTVTGLSASGAIDGPLVDLNGADKVTIDGRVNKLGVKDLTIVNTSATVNDALAISAIRFINSAENNKVKYCTIKASAQSTNSGILLFSTASASNGNSGNRIDNCDLTRDASRPYQVVYSNGSAGFENKNDTVSNCNIYNFFKSNASSHGIYIYSNSTAWAITGNNLYESTAVVPVAGAWTYYFLRVDNTSGNNFTISDNFIGGTSASHTGTWTVSSASGVQFRGIYLKVGSTTASSVQNNTIQGIDFTSATLSEIWDGIRIIAGNVNVGTVTGNVIGTASAPITVTSSALTAETRAIFTASAGNVFIQNNSIGMITTAGPATTAHGFTGIGAASTGNTNISNNLVGSTTVAGSITASSISSTRSQEVYGIISTGNGTRTIDGNTVTNLVNGTTNPTNSTSGQTVGILAEDGAFTITNNTISHLSIASNNSGVQYLSVMGIFIGGNSDAQTVTGNTIHDLSNSYEFFTGSIGGINVYMQKLVMSNISRNFIYNISVNPLCTAATIYGIKIGSGSANYTNNIITLGGTSSTVMYGILETDFILSTNNLYYNTVYLSGSSSDKSSYALYSATTATTRNFRNNIFYNARTKPAVKSTTANPPNHYAAYFAATAGTLTCDYNDYFVSPSGVLGFYGSAKTALPIVTGVTGNDDHSTKLNPIFAGAGGTTAASYKPSETLLVAQTGTGITSDYAGLITRSTSFPSMGAWEYAVTPKVEVTATLGTTGPSPYSTLKQAFDAINLGTHQGVITVKINASTTETASAVINASGSGTSPNISSYTAVTVYPTVTGLSISGNLNAPLIDLNGADKVTIDGRVNQAGAKSLTIVNTYGVASVLPVSAIRFINSAENNKVNYCTVKASALNAFSGVILFSTAIASNGNSGNRIDNCDITQDVNRPFNMVLSVGSSGYDNKNDTVSNCNIYNCFKNDASSCGVYILDNSTDWVITGNNFYETTTVVPTGPYEYVSIRIENTFGNNFTVSNNVIGGNAADHTGILTINGLSWHNFTGIVLSVGSTTASSVQNNTIKNMSYTNIGEYAWIGIGVSEGKVNVGTVVGNTIGSSTGTGSILLANSSANRISYGIYAYQGEMNIQNNVIGSITTTGSATFAHSFYGIYNEGTTTGPTIISNNVIGSATTSNSINASSASTSPAQTVYGIYNQGSGTVTISGNTIAKMTNGTTNANEGTYGSIQGIKTSNGANTITNNTIRDLTIANANNSITSSASVIGICQTSTTAGQTISGNTIYDLSNTNSGSVTDNVTGMYYSGGTDGINSVSGNFIHSLRVSSSNYIAGVRGLHIETGTATFANNIISLGSDLNADYSVNGIYENCPASNNPDYYFNTVYLGGNAGTGSQMTHAFISVSSTNLKNIKNNIFINSRTGTTAKRQCAVRLQYMSGITGLIIDNNDYYAPNTGGILGKKGPSTTYATLEGWQGYTGQDSKSKALDPVFASAGGTLAANYLPSNLAFLAATGTGITTDYSNTVTRSTFAPSMGGWEYAVTPPPVIVTATDGTTGPTAYNTLKEAFDAINLGTHKG